MSEVSSVFHVWESLRDHLARRMKKGDCKTAVFTLILYAYNFAIDLSFRSMDFALSKYRQFHATDILFSIVSRIALQVTRIARQS